MSKEIKQQNFQNEVQECVDIASSTLEDVHTGQNIVKELLGEDNVNEIGSKKVAGATSGAIIGSVIGGGLAVGLGFTMLPGFIVGGITTAIIGGKIGGRKD